MSYASSAGMVLGVQGYGKTCRKDVLRRVDVPVVPGAANGARPVPRGQAKLGDPMPTCRARLGRRVPPVDDDQPAPVSFAFV